MQRALLAGTFDPPTLGHLDLIDRASKVCDELIIGVALNPAKQSSFSLQQREALLQKLKPQLKVTSFAGLTVEFAKQHRISFLIRGLRSINDLERELQLAVTNKQLSEIETLFLPGNPLYAHISSSLIRELAFNNMRLHQLVPALIEEEIYQRFCLKN
ncbi:MAG: pantetheine-phosphate adenylyltransferase [Verrucomicrobia bacterium]|nr:pantetheine-phosphate adenylyltransferase [Verrucomicrobiota bacterium]